MYCCFVRDENQQGAFLVWYEECTVREMAKMPVILNGVFLSPGILEELLHFSAMLSKVKIDRCGNYIISKIFFLQKHIV